MTRIIFKPLPRQAWDFVQIYLSEWSKRYGKDTTVPRAKACSQLRRLQKAVGDEELESLIRYYVHSWPDPFGLRCGHSLGAFVASVTSIQAAYASRVDVVTATVDHPDAERLSAARLTKEDDSGS